MSTQQKNGTGATQKGAEKTTAVADMKPAETPQPQTKPEGDKGKVITLPAAPAAMDELPPVEERILRVAQLFSLVEKHEALLETQKKLNAFKLSTDGNRDQLELVDSRGNDFVTYNSAVIADVLHTLHFSINAKIADVESQIRF